MKGKKYDDSVKAGIFELLANKFSATEISAKTGIPIKTIYNWISKSKKAEKKKVTKVKRTISKKPDVKSDVKKIVLNIYISTQIALLKEMVRCHENKDKAGEKYIAPFAEQISNVVTALERGE